MIGISEQVGLLVILWAVMDSRCPTVTTVTVREARSPLNEQFLLQTKSRISALVESKTCDGEVDNWL